MFSEKSAVVHSWCRRIKSGNKTFDDIPPLFNLQEVVKATYEKYYSK